MTPEDFKTIAAFGGLILGILNLFISIYKDFLRKAKLRLKIENAGLKYVGNGDYYLQLDFLLSASGGDVYLKDMYLCHSPDLIRKFDFEIDVKDKIPLYRLADRMPVDLLALPWGDWYDRTEELVKSAPFVRGLKIAEKSLLSKTVSFSLEFPQKQKGEWPKLPLKGWSILAEYGNKSIEVPFNFKEHPASIPDGFQG